MLFSETSLAAGCADDLESAAGCGQVPSECVDAALEPQPAAECAGAPTPEAAATDPSAPPSPPKTVRELEAALRGLGYSRSQATNIARHGFSEVAHAKEESGADELEEMAAALARLSAAFGAKL